MVEHPPSNRITLDEVRSWQEQYELAYERGETYQECTWCKNSVAELTAIWEFYPGTGTLIHQYCLRDYLLWFEASTWLKLAVDEAVKPTTGEFDFYMRMFEVSASLPVFERGFAAYPTLTYTTGREVLDD